MNKELPQNSNNRSINSANIQALPFNTSLQEKPISPQRLADFLEDIQNKLNQGLAKTAENIASEMLEVYSLTFETRTHLHYQISIALQMQGKFKQSAEVLQHYDNEEIIENLNAENQTLIYKQLGVVNVYEQNFKHSLNCLNKALKIAEERDFTQLYSTIHLAFTLYYQEQNEYPIARNYLERAIKFARDAGNWRDLAETYRVKAAILQETGDSEKALEIYQQAIKIIGDRHAGFHLGQIYCEISGVYAALFQPTIGIEQAKKALSIFEKSDNNYYKILTNNNLAANLLFKGEWQKAEEILNRTVENALETDHRQLPVIICNVARLNFLRGDLAEAERLFVQAFLIAEETNIEWVIIHISYYWAHCLLAQKKSSAAIKKVEEIFERCRKIGETRLKSLAFLHLAECYLKQNKIFDAEEVLQKVEESEMSANFLTIGTIAKFRGLISIQKKDDISAIHYFTQSVANFEKTEDIYELGLANLKLGKVLVKTQPEQAQECLTKSLNIFQQLQLNDKVQAIEDYLAKLKQVATLQNTNGNLQSNLLLLRLLKSISSRKALFRELLDIVQEMEGIQKAIVSEATKSNQFLPSHVVGFSTTEGVELVAKIQKIQVLDELEKFAEFKQISVFHLNAPNALPAFLVTSPPLKSTLSDGSLLQPLLKIVELGMELCALRERTEEIAAEIDSGNISTNNLMTGFIHSSPAMKEVVEEIHRIRTSDVTVLITGESGTGKELIAKAVHLVSQRKSKPFIPFNCTAVPKELTEGHLFGYKKGAFTGAVENSPGVIRAADGGTLFLDEIGDLPIDVQPKLLRFLQEGEVQTLGEKSPQKVDVRIIAATNMNLEEKVAQGLFREDLYYRLNVIRLYIPALRDRRSEIPELVNYYLKYYSDRFGRKDLTINSAAMDLLIAFNWQGNIRQLCNEVQRIVARSDSGARVTPEFLSPELRPSKHQFAKITGNVRATAPTAGSINVQTSGGKLNEIVSAVEIQLINQAMERHYNNISRAARQLGLTRRGLYLKIERYKMQFADEEI